MLLNVSIFSIGIFIIISMTILFVYALAYHSYTYYRLMCAFSQIALQIEEGIEKTKECVRVKKK